MCRCFGLGGHVIADGGCNTGDIVKAFGGADFVMIGGMLSGHDECAGDLIFEDDNRSRRYEVLRHGFRNCNGETW